MTLTPYRLSSRITVRVDRKTCLAELCNHVPISYQDFYTVVRTHSHTSMGRGGDPDEPPLCLLSERDHCINEQGCQGWGPVPLRAVRDVANIVGPKGYGSVHEHYVFHY